MRFNSHFNNYIELSIFVDPNSQESNIELGTFEYPFKV